MNYIDHECINFKKDWELLTMQSFFLYVTSIILFLLACNPSQANNETATNKERDLLNVFEKALDAKAEIDTVFTNRLDQLQTKTPDSYLNICKKALDISQKAEAKIYTLDLLERLGDHYLKQDSLVSALNYYKKIVVIPTNNFQTKGRTYNNIGIIYHGLGDTAKAIEHYLQSVEAYGKTLETKVLQTYPLGNIADLYISTDIKTAKSYNLKALSFSLQLEEPERSYNLMYDYYRLGHIFNTFRQLDSAKYYYTKSAEQARINKSPELITTVHLRYINFYLEQNDLLQAEAYIDSCYQILDKIRENVTLNSIHLQTAKVKLKQGLFMQAEQAANKIKVDENKSFLLEVYLFWKNYYFATENPYEALQYQDKYYQLNAEINSQERGKNLGFLEAKFQGEEKEQHIKLLEIEKKNQTRLFLIVIGSAILLLFFTMILIRLLRTRTKNAQLLQVKNERLLEAETKLQKKNQELEKYISYNLQLENFAHLASHDLREPLLNILGFSDLLQAETNKNLNEAAKNYIKYIQASSKRMEHLLDDLLKYAIIGKYSTPKNIDCNKLLKKVLSEDLISNIEESNAQIKVAVLPSIYGYQSELQSLFTNLLHNAIKYRKKGVNPIIYINVEDEKTHWKFSVTDNGMGIALENHEKAFLIYKRLNNFQTEEKGTGIGLAYCKKVVELHKGKIWIESALKAGTTFYFTIQKNCIFDCPQEYKHGSTTENKSTLGERLHSPKHI
ncbi:MAG: ATP-binding protein [Chitinophagales bacterium]